MRRWIIVTAGFLLGFGLAAGGAAHAEGICVIFTETTDAALRATSLTVADVPQEPIPEAVAQFRQGPSRDGVAGGAHSITIDELWIGLREQP